MAGIYCIKNIESNKIYIGQTIRPFNLRFNEHKSRLRTNKHKNKHLQSAWNKYGKENFEFHQIEECLVEIIDLREKYWIEHFKQIQEVYNLGCDVKNPMRGRKHSKETIQKMKERESPFKGRFHSVETKEILSVKAKNQDQTKKYKKVERINRYTGEVKEYESIKSTKKDGFLPNKIVECCKQRANIHKGFYWKYGE